MSTPKLKGPGGPRRGPGLALPVWGWSPGREDDHPVGVPRRRHRHHRRLRRHRRWPDAWPWGRSKEPFPDSSEQCARRARRRGRCATWRARSGPSSGPRGPRTDAPAGGHHPRAGPHPHLERPDAAGRACAGCGHASPGPTRPRQPAGPAVRRQASTRPWEEVEPSWRLTWVWPRRPHRLAAHQGRCRGSRPPFVAGCARSLLTLVDPSMDRSIVSSRVDGRPACVLVVGVNGTGKTTTVGTRVLVAQDKDAVLGAADTFRSSRRPASRPGASASGCRRSAPTARAPTPPRWPRRRQGRCRWRPTSCSSTPPGASRTRSASWTSLGKVKSSRSRARPARPRRHNRPERDAPGRGLLAGGRHHRHRARRDRQGRHRRHAVWVCRPLFVGLGEGPDDPAPSEPEAFVDALLD